MKRKPLVYLPEKQGDIGPLPSGDKIDIDRNFSPKKIPSGETVKIPINEQALVFGEMEIQGELIIEGELCLF